VIFSTHNMSSVEELCDHITLINNSQNILTGAVSELRHRFAGKNVRLTFNGDSNVLKAAIENMAIILGEGENDQFRR